MVLVPRYSGSTTTTDVSPSDLQRLELVGAAGHLHVDALVAEHPGQRPGRRPGPGLSGSIGIEVWAPVPSTTATATAATRARPMRSDERCRRTSPG